MLLLVKDDPVPMLLLVKDDPVPMLLLVTDVPVPMLLVVPPLDTVSTVTRKLCGNIKVSIIINIRKARYGAYELSEIS